MTMSNFQLPQVFTPEEYDPYKHRNVPEGTSFVETLIHMIKCNVGTGLLAMPQAFSRAGMANGIISTLVIGWMVTHCLRLLLLSQYAVCKKERVPLLNYPTSLRLCINLGPPCMRWSASVAPLAINFFLVTYQLGVCCVYIVFISSNIKKFMDPYKEIALIIYMVIILFPLICINLIRNLKTLAPLSFVANVLMIAGLSIVSYYMVTTTKTEADILMVGELTDYPLYYGTTIFALTATGVVISLENNMKNPENFCTPTGVLNIGMLVVTLMYVVIGGLGYRFCRDQCSDTITLDLPEGGLQKAMLLMFVGAIFISYSLHSYVPVEIIWRDYIMPRRKEDSVTGQYILRICLCLLTFALAAAVPKLGLFISLFGALCLSMLGMVFPAFMDICLRHPSRYGPCAFILFFDIFLILAGLFGAVSGTYFSLKAIVESFSEPEAPATNSTSYMSPSDE